MRSLLKLCLSLFVVSSASANLGTPIVSNNFIAPADWSWWVATGNLSETANGLTSASNGALIYAASVPADYEVRQHYRFYSSGGSYVTYFRASNNANLHADTGSFFAVELTNVSVNAGSCTARLNLHRRDSVANATSLITYTDIVCSSEFPFAVLVKGDQIMVYRPDVKVTIAHLGLGGVHATPSQPYLQPGVGIASPPAANSVSSAIIYNRETTPPPTPPVPIVSTSTGKVEMQWLVAPDGQSGGAFHQIFRANASTPNTWEFKTGLMLPNTMFVDRTAQNGASYLYLVRSVDLHLNWSDTVVSVVTPAAGAFDPRQTGIRPTGTYWGAGPEQIDIQSGNLNYTVPILEAKSRAGWSVPFALNYNSQMWRRDLANGAIWYYGRNFGYGHGWRLLAGSVMPVYSDWYELAYYLYIDSSGAEYRLDQNSGNVWSGKEGVFVSYDANTNRLYFNDGSFWVMGATSAGLEFDSGTKYPTLMQDTNGNQVTVTYVAGVNAPYANSSSRISTIKDTVSQYSAPASYYFNYTNGNLTTITNSSSVPQWQFAYTTGTANTPWTPNQNPANTVQVLLAVTNSATGGTHAFQYYSTGEMEKATLPRGGSIRWGYTDWTSGSQRVVREVNARLLKKDTTAAETTHWFIYDPNVDAGKEYHPWKTVTDGQYDKAWFFDTNRRLSIFDERRAGYVTTVRKSFQWSLTPSTNHPYISLVDTTLEPGSGSAMTRRSTQARNQYGNVTTAEEWDYGLSQTTRKIYTTNYLTDPNYTSRYIRNRMTQMSVKVGDAGAPTVVAGATYDSLVGHPCGSPNGGNFTVDPANVYLHDLNYVSAVYRGNPTSSFARSQSSCQWYDYLGVVRVTRGSSGTTMITPDATKWYAVPATITANGYSTSFSWDSLLNPTQVTGPNSATSLMGYDSIGRPTSTQDADGGTSSASYSLNSTVTKQGKRETVTTLDGLGRPTKVETGYRPTPTAALVVDSVVDTEYAPCACTPLGKVKRVSKPHKPTDPVVWTEYQYDELGRVKTVTHPPNTGSTGNSGVTTYVYVLNTVKVTNPADRWKKYTMNGFGDLAAVEEPKPAGGGSYVSNYTYNAFGELQTVTMTRDGFNGHVAQQVTQTRTFQYSDGQLTATTFPEVPGTTNYYYSNGQLVGKKNYKGVWKYIYNTNKQLIRVEKYPGATVYPPTTNEDLNGRVSYYYDTHPLATSFVSEYPQGRRVAMAYTATVTGGYSAVREFYSYTRGGRLKKKRLDRGDNSWFLDVSFEYDTAGKMQYMVYPSGKRVRYTYDDMDRHKELKNVDGSTETNLVYNLQYGVGGQLTSMSTQSSIQSWSYNNHLQMTGYSHSGVGGVISHTYKYSGTANDGKLSSRKDNVSGEEVEYTYDLLHRLKTASVLAGTLPAGQEWGQSYIYDGFGNMKQKIGYAAASTTGFNISLSSATNNGGAAPGDMDDRITSMGGEQYGYAPDNKRIHHSNRWILWVGSMRVGMYLVGPWNATTQRYDVAAVKEDFYVAGQRVAPSDRLGSDLTGGVKLLPYGEELTYPPVAHDRTKFATYHRDNNGFDYADQRYYQPGLGRFLTADPSGYVDVSEPGSWNQYTYVQGDPVNYVDTSGEFRIPVISGIGNFLGSLLGLISRVPPLPSPQIKMSPFERQKVHNETVDRWVRDLAIAVAAAVAVQDEDPEEQRRYPKYLVPATDRCYKVGNGSIQRDISYELYDDTGHFMSGATITEELVALEGYLPVTGRTSTGQPGGIFNDQHSALSGGSRVLLQRFTVTTLPGIGDYVPASNMPVFVRGFGGEFGVLYLDIRPDSIKIQGVGGSGCGK